MVIVSVIFFLVLLFMIYELSHINRFQKTNQVQEKEEFVRFNLQDVKPIHSTSTLSVDKSVNAEDKINDVLMEDVGKLNV